MKKALGWVRYPAKIALSVWHWIKSVLAKILKWIRALISIVSNSRLMRPARKAWQRLSKSRLGVKVQSLRFSVSNYWKNQRAWSMIWLIGVILLILTAISWVFLRPSFELQAITNARSNVQQIADDLSKLQPPRLIELGQKDTTLKHQTDQLTLKISSPVTTTSFPPVWAYKINIRRSRVNLAQPPDFAKLSDDYGQAVATVNNLYNYQLGVLITLRPIFEYNPIAEFAVINPSSSTFTGKIDGFIQTVNDTNLQLDKVISGSKTKDNHSDDMKATIQKLVDAAKSFKQNKDLQKFGDDITQVQHQIVTNRQAFWTESVKDSTDQLRAVDEQLAQIELALSALQ